MPDVMCTDRQTGMLGLYLAAPLTRDTYLAMKAAAVTSVITVVTLGPPVLLLVGYSMLDLGPGWPGDGLAARAAHRRRRPRRRRLVHRHRLVASSLTPRRAAASAGIVLATLVSAAVVGGLVEGAGMTPWLRPGATSTTCPSRSCAGSTASPARIPELRTVPLVAYFVGAIVGMGAHRADPLPAPDGDEVTAPRHHGRTGRPRWRSPSVELSAVSKWFGDVIAVSEVSFALWPGVTALLGPNGAGKSTVLRVMCGLTPPSRGRVQVLGRDPRADVAVTRAVGLVPQQEALFERQRALEFVRLAGQLHRVAEPGRVGPRRARRRSSSTPTTSAGWPATPRACASG